MREVTRIIPNGTPTVKKLRVAAYCRVSSNSADQLHSYATQIRVYTSMIQSNPEWELVEIFADEGISGTSADKREEFLRMIRMCELKKIDLIITKSVSRFARNVKEVLEYVRKLKLLGIGVKFEKEGINTVSLGDEMLLNTFAAIAQEESVAISQRLRWSNKKRMSQGEYITSNAPYGYRLVEGALMIHEEEAKIIRWIFQCYADGNSATEIAAELDKRQVPTKAGQSHWRYNTIIYILANEKYIGDSLYQKRFNAPMLPFKEIMNRGEEDQYYVCNTHQAIVERELYDSVQKLLNDRRNNHSHIVKPNNYPLTSRILCLECGSFYRRKAMKGCISWGCTTHIRDRTQCDSQYYREERIYEGLIEIFNQLRFSEEDILSESIRLLEFAINMKKRNNLQAREASQNLVDLNNKMLMLEELRGKGYLSPEVYESQAREINSRIAEIKRQRAELLVTKLEVAYEEIKMLQNRLNQYEEPLEQFDEELFKDTVKSIAIDKNRIMSVTFLGDLEFTKQL